ncbi:MAG: SDR family NAD(P)-dependent oxidoreductase [Pseudomonadota bacterium]
MKTMLITGATSGIGEATVKAAAEQGYRVIACGRNADKLKQLAASSPSITTLAFDVTDLDACKDALAGLSPDITVLNAGVCEYVDIDSWDSQMFRRVFDANFFGVVHCLEAMLPTLQSGQQLLIVDSLARLLPFTRSQAYGASKAALFYLSKTLDVDLRGRGVRVQTVSPGFVKTPLTDKNDFKMPLRISPDQAADAILRAAARGTRTGYFPAVFASIIRALSALPVSAQLALCRTMRNAS